MRFLQVTYIRKPNGQIDEQVGFSAKLKSKDLQTTSVIVDFKESKVVKCVIEGKIVPTDFQKLVEYYRQHYPELIEQLEKNNIEGLK